MTWNYRIGKKQKVSPTGELWFEFAIYEFYYNKKGQVVAHSLNPIPLTGEFYKDVKEDYKMMGEAFNHPPIDLDRIKFSKR